MSTPAPPPEDREPPRSLPQQQRRAAYRRRRDFTLVVTNASKVAGLIFGVLEATSPHPDKASLIFFGFLILGVQRAEELVLASLDRFLGGKE
jgi:hypothetical protein